MPETVVNLAWLVLFLPLLAAIGIYGVTAYTVERRTPEVGLRMALGADRGDVLREVLKHALSQVLVGLVLGVPLALVLGRLMAAHLYNVSSYNPMILSSAFATLGTSAPSKLISTPSPLIATGSKDTMRSPEDPGSRGVGNSVSAPGKSRGFGESPDCRSDRSSIATGERTLRSALRTVVEKRRPILDGRRQKTSAPPSCNSPADKPARESR